MHKDFAIWDNQYDLTITDPGMDESKVSGFPVLAKVSGPHFKPNGKSRNDRYYEKQLWTKAMANEDFKNRLDRKLLFGTIGHASDWDPEKFMREGLVSHITSKIWIDEKNGLGNCEDLILDTPAGRALNTYLRAGSRPYTSSRAQGKLSDRKVNNVPVVDPDDYRLEGFDFVLSPGFLEADPKLESIMESLEEPLRSNHVLVNIDEIDKVASPSRSYKMAEQIKDTINSNIITDTGGNNDMDEKTIIESLTTEKLAIEKALGEALNSLNEYKSLGTVEELSTLVSEIKQFKDLGSLEEISKALDEGEKLLNQYKELGSPEEVKTNIDKLQENIDAYSDLGSPEEVTEAFDKAEELLQTVQTYKELGSPEEIGEALDRALEMAKKYRDERLEKTIKDLSTRFKMPEASIREMVETINDVDKVEGILSKIVEGRPYNKVKENSSKKLDESVASTFNTLINKK